MIKKFIVTILIATLFSANATVPETGMKKLSSAFDAFNYSINVEWNQKDKTFYNKRVNELAEVIKGLQKQGLSNEDIVKFTMSRIKNEKLAKDIWKLMDVISIEKMSAAETMDYVMQYVSKSNAHGVSWDYDGIAPSGIVCVSVVALLIIVGLPVLFAVTEE